MEELAAGAFSSLEDLFGGEAVQEVNEMKESVTPFKTVAMVHVSSLVIVVALVGCFVIFLLSCFYGVNFGVFSVYLAKYYVSLHHEFN